MIAKYIITENGPIIFGEGLNHRDVGRSWRAKSAGKLVFGESGELSVRHGSVSLNIDRDQFQEIKDKKYLEHFIKNYYY